MIESWIYSTAGLADAQIYQYEQASRGICKQFPTHNCIVPSIKLCVHIYPGLRHLTNQLHDRASSALLTSLLISPSFLAQQSSKQAEKKRQVALKPTRWYVIRYTYTAPPIHPSQTLQSQIRTITTNMPPPISYICPKQPKTNKPRHHQQALP